MYFYLLVMKKPNNYLYLEIRSTLQNVFFAYNLILLIIEKANLLDLKPQNKWKILHVAMVLFVILCV